MSVVKFSFVISFINEINLGDYIFISNAEERNKGRTKSSILSDAFEAIMGAIYLESGLETLKPIILKLLEDSYDKINLDVLFSDYKTALQEITKARFASIPEYIVEGSYGPDHKKEFEVSIKIDGRSFGKASGKSKKLAQQAVAKIAIEKLREEDTHI